MAYLEKDHRAIRYGDDSRFAHLVRRVSPGELPVLLIALGMTHEAFASFEKAIEVRDPRMGLLKVDPAFEPIRDDPRYADLVRRVGLPN